MSDAAEVYHFGRHRTTTVQTRSKWSVRGINQDQMKLYIYEDQAFSYYYGAKQSGQCQ